MNDRSSSAETLIKHLEFVHSAVTRLANNSFLIRGWSITLTGALVGVSVSGEDKTLALASLITVIGFWALDAFYLRQERMFRKLYSSVAHGETGIPAFSMDISPYRSLVRRRNVIFSPAICIFHAPLLLVVLVVILWN